MAIYGCACPNMLIRLASQRHIHQCATSFRPGLVQAPDSHPGDLSCQGHIYLACHRRHIDPLSPRPPLFRLPPCYVRYSSSSLLAESMISGRSSNSSRSSATSRSRSISPSREPLNGLPASEKMPAFMSGKSSSSKTRSTLIFCGLAVFTGFILHLLFLGLGGGEAVKDAAILKDWVSGPKTTSAATASAVEKEACPTPSPQNIPAPIQEPHPPTTVTVTVELPAPTQLVEDVVDYNPSIDELRAMVSKTKGYFGRDYSLGLGWNNVCGNFLAAQIRKEANSFLVFR